MQIFHNIIASTLAIFLAVLFTTSVIFELNILFGGGISAFMSLVFATLMLIHKRNQKRVAEAAEFILSESKRQAKSATNRKAPNQPTYAENKRALEIVDNLKIMGMDPDGWDGQKKTLKKRYHVLASSLHSDKHRTTSLTDYSFIEIKTAYETLLKLHGWTRAL